VVHEPGVGVSGDVQQGRWLARREGGLAGQALGDEAQVRWRQLKAPDGRATLHRWGGRQGDRLRHSLLAQGTQKVAERLGRLPERSEAVDLVGCLAGDAQGALACGRAKHRALGDDGGALGQSEQAGRDQLSHGPGDLRPDAVERHRRRGGGIGVGDGAELGPPLAAQGGGEVGCEDPGAVAGEESLNVGLQQHGGVAEDGVGVGTGAAELEAQLVAGSLDAHALHRPMATCHGKCPGPAGHCTG